MIRAQYHFRKTATGLDAWEVRRLIELSRDLPVKHIDPEQVQELNANHWYMHTSVIPSPRSIIEHMGLIQACDLAYPIILDAQGRVMDGMHRICKAVLEQVSEIPAVQFVIDPPPDYIDCDPATLPYDKKPGIHPAANRRSER